jgi:hypothetical protein
MEFNKSEVYNILDNGNRPQRVIINRLDKSVKVYKTMSKSEALIKSPDELLEHLDDNYHFTKSKWEDVNKPVLILYENYVNIFIGDIPKDSENIYKQHDKIKDKGNTILLEIEPKTGTVPNYLWIGNRGIIRYYFENEIVEFYSPVGNNGVPYPFAVDEDNNFILLLDNIRFKNNGCIDPYRYYYDLLDNMSNYEKFVTDNTPKDCDKIESWTLRERGE